MRAHAADAARLLKALANEQRLHILCNLLDGPLSVGELHQRLDLSQSALSQHLALLREWASWTRVAKHRRFTTRCRTGPSCA
jgi:ArsR family transcriptional regulator, virulence genes transcriptional regulator